MNQQKPNEAIQQAAIDALEKLPDPAKLSIVDYLESLAEIQKTKGKDHES